MSGPSISGYLFAIQKGVDEIRGHLVDLPISWLGRSRLQVALDRVERAVGEVAAEEAPSPRFLERALHELRALPTAIRAAGGVGIEDAADAEWLESWASTLTGEFPGEAMTLADPRSGLVN